MNKRTCYGCRALDYKERKSSCLLNFPIKIRLEGPKLPEPAPEVKCPKPRTYRALFRLLGGTNA